MLKNILFDFDGVILDSMPIRDFGFREIFKEFPQEEVEKLIEFHRKNGGLSRFVKIRYFFEEILGEKISEEKILEIANTFSKIMKSELANKKYLIRQTLEFLKESNHNLHIVSGSEEKELQFLCEQLEISHLFISIHGSPTPKGKLVANLIKKQKYKKSETLLIGDSINDYEAASENGIEFYGYNNLELKKFPYLTSFDPIWKLS
jgi:HAD superfamily hydrolase (TIGR01549 family)